ncbi:MAG: hypothetical protein HFF69_06365 [Oscillospiraceae bacterium]|jgi:hypothetical protein|nr:hypothetical protein [Oscillospiraceae bacterium]
MLNPQSIGQAMNHGYAGSYARQPDMIVNTRPAGDAVIFGAALKYDANGAVAPMGAGDTAEDFVGVASREVKSALNYLEQSAGSYAKGEAVPVFQRGSINVRCGSGTPQLGGAVYVRIAASDSIPTAVVGSFEAQADGANTVELTNCQWAGPADANGIAELRILTMNKA